MHMGLHGPIQGLLMGFEEELYRAVQRLCRAKRGMHGGSGA